MSNKLRRHVLGLVCTSLFGVGCLDEAGPEPGDDELETASSALSDPEANAYLKSRLEALRAKYNIPGLAAALVDDGDTVAIAVSGIRREGYANPVALGDTFMLKSCTKPMTGMLIAKLIEDGWIDWDTKISTIFPEVPRNAAYDEMTVSDLMAHETGMPIVPVGEPADEYASLGSLPNRRYAYVHDALDDLQVALAPAYQYSGGSIIVAAMAERLTGLSWESLITNLVWKPLGMTTAGVRGGFSSPGTIVASHTRSGTTNVPWNPPFDYATEAHAPAGRNTHASIGDFAKFVAGNLPYATKGTRIVQDATLTQMHMKMAFSGFTKGGFSKQASPWGGNYQVLSHNGMDGKDYSLMMVSPWENFGFVVMTNVQDAGPANELTGELPALRRHMPAATHYSSEHIAVTGAYASNVYGGDPQYAALKAFDGSFTSRWATDNGTTTASITALFGGLHSFTKVVITEEYANRVQGFRIDRWNGSTWATVHTGTTIGSNRVIQLAAPVTASAVRLVVTAASAPVTISELWFNP